MCLILFAHKAHPDYPLVIAANRDEAYARPTAPAAFWADNNRIYGGRDLEQGGTWLGISRAGGFAAVTNYRSAGTPRSSSHSRGELVANYLRGQQPPAEYLEQVYRDANTYNGFNLIAGSIDELRYLSNRSDPPARIEPGIHGLSNHLLDTAWPKVERGKAVLTELLAGSTQGLIEALFNLLGERTLAADTALPATGVGVARERVLSPAFIVSPGYGTRSSTVVLVDNHGKVTFIERTFGENGIYSGITSARFELDTAPTAATA